MRALKHVVSTVLALVAVLCCLPSLALASQTSRKKAAHPTKPLVFHPQFHKVATNSLIDLTTTGRYIILAENPSAPVDVVIDDQTGTTTTVHPPANCGSGGNIYQIALTPGEPWLPFQCSANDPQTFSFELYSLVTGQWRPVPTPPPGGGVPLTLGADWISYSVYCGEEHCYNEIDYQNLNNGQPYSGSFIEAQASGNTLLDFNAPQLAVKLCSPLRVPPGTAVTNGENTASIVVDGRFAIAQYPTHNKELVATYLEQCGSRAREQLFTGDLPYEVNAHMVIWWQQSSSRVVSGLFLPGRQRFTFTLPSSVRLAANSNVALGPRHLYVFSNSSQLLAAPIPTLPKKAAKK